VKRDRLRIPPITGFRHSLGLILLLTASPTWAAGWQSALTKDPPGNFPPPPLIETHYHFGWSGLTAATADATFSKPEDDLYQLEGVGRTVGLARILWKFEVNYRSTAHTGTLRPIETNQTETYRSKKIVTHLAFNSNGVRRIRTDSSNPNPPKPREFNLTNLFDLTSAMLYLRSQPLKNGDIYRVAVYPGADAYVATFTVVRREKISVHAGTYNVIKLDLDLKKIGKDFELEPHKKFKRAIVWVSDDNNRIPLRAEAQIFIGTVFAELQSVRFKNEPVAK
jgi:hypothetical protein